MKLRSVTYALLIAGVATFSTSSLAAQSLRFGYETSQTDSQHIAAKKFNELLQEKTKGELKLKLFPDSTLGNAQAMISGVRGGTIDMEMSGSNNFTGLSPVIRPAAMSRSCSAIPLTRIKRSTAKSVMT